MLRRYTAKIRAKRIELHYFKQLHRFRRLKLILTVGAPALAAGWLLVLAARGDQTIYTSGPVSTAHAMFGLQCGQCHAPAQAANQAGPARRGFWLRVSEQACLTCHDAPVHHANEIFTPGCNTCHVEHEGHVVLASMSDRHCTRCHADLKTRDAATGYERSIRSFHAGHPEFAVTVKDKTRLLRVRLDDAARLKDTAQMKLNHQKHLKAGLKGVDELKARKGTKGLSATPAGLQLACSYCHQPDARQAYLAPIRYALHCGPACHPLDFDARLPGAEVPHDRPLITRAFLREAFTSAFEQCQPLQKAEGGGGDRATEELKTRCQELGLIKGAEEAERPRGRVGRREEPEEVASPQQWVAAQIQSAEATLFKQKCEFCHTLTSAPEKLPEVALPAIPVRWLSHSRFDHGIHRVLACAECHRAAQSTATTDVLLPSIATCRECHRAGGGTRSGCVECHLYHDKTRERDLNGPFTIRELATGAPQPAAARPPRSGS
ncbi:MAG: hypothetical protein HY726_21795 [Candidatus Rokubacteria bacterium]|nr:hypothetical protein [Candidatus Rokubacteria bacterium]